MVIVGNIICECRDLCLCTRMCVQLKIMHSIVARQSVRHGLKNGAIMLCDPFKALPCQVQPVPLCIMALKRCHNADRLRIVIKPAKRLHQSVKRVLASMAKGRVAQVMRQRDCLGEFRIESKCAADRARHLCHFNRMSQPRAIIIALMFQKNLRLVFQTAKGTGMNDPVSIPLKTTAKSTLALGIKPPARVLWSAGKGGHLKLHLVSSLPPVISPHIYCIKPLGKPASP